MENAIIEQFLVKGGRGRAHAMHQLPYEANIVKKIFIEVIEAGKYDPETLSILEANGYLEKYLWPVFLLQSDTVSLSYLTLSLVLMLLQKVKQSLSPWDCICKEKEPFSAFIRAVCQEVLRNNEQSVYSLTLLKHCYLSFDVEPVRTECLKYTSLTLWQHLTPSALDKCFSDEPILLKAWKKLANRSAKEIDYNDFFYDQITVWKKAAGIESCLQYSQHTIDFWTILLSQLSTRRFVYPLLADQHVIVWCKRSMHMSFPSFQQSVSILELIMSLHMDSSTLDRLEQHHYEAISDFQKLAFQPQFRPALDELALCHPSALSSNPDKLRNLLSGLPSDKLKQLAIMSGLVDESVVEHCQDMILDIFVEHCTSLKHPLLQIQNWPILPTEVELFGEETDYHSLQHGAVFPHFKLTLQYLSLLDYLFRYLTLYNYEATWSIRQDILDAIRRMSPTVGLDNKTEMTGWSRMAVPISFINVVEVSSQTCLTTNLPEYVRLNISYSLSHLELQSNVAMKEEWDTLKVGDILFLISVSISKQRVAFVVDDELVEYPFEITSVRGCEFVSYIDQHGKSTLSAACFKGTADRMMSVHLDSRRPQDVDDGHFNVLLRRNPKENNFKFVLQTILDAIKYSYSLPSWLTDVFLGYGEPETTTLAASLSLSHPHHIHRQLEYTPKQLEAIESGTKEHGLTLIVGPPGTGKTDVAVQILVNLYHQYPTEKILVVTRSNHALNQLFEKLIAIEHLDPKHLLRLGHGEQGMKESSESRFSKAGRLQYIQDRKTYLLLRVDQMAASIGMTGADYGSTCETAENFYRFHICPRWEAFQVLLQSKDDPITLETISIFPFLQFFEVEFQEKLNTLTSQRSELIAFIEESFHDKVQCVFEELSTLRPFEVIRAQREQYYYLLSKMSRIVAMTSTFAAVKRNELRSAPFSYSTVLVEEASQMMDIETTIPLLNSTEEVKRFILIGDQNQLPPIIQCTALKRCCHMEQTLFSRFLKLGVCPVVLDMQGRCRPALASLFNWKYTALGNIPLDNVPEHNNGFSFEYQWIDVGDYLGQGETSPVRHFYQNLGEAEYICAVYQYMRLVGYPSEKIVVLTSYSGQKNLLIDVFAYRCAKDPRFGLPERITTVDHYQGRQSDFILLSLVRTKNVGHIRDHRRLIVAFSRARLGLYVFGRWSLFSACDDLLPVTRHFEKLPKQLSLLWPSLASSKLINSVEAMNEFLVQTFDSA